MRFFYTLILYLLSPFVLIRLYLLGIKRPAYRLKWQERFGFLSSQTSKPTIWIHAVSVGEVNAAKPVIEHLLKNYPRYAIVVTTITPTGAMTVKQHFGDTILHHYLPYDLPFAIHRFLTKVKPSLFITMETEIWPNLYQACYAAKIPILIINARLSEKSKKAYQRLARFTKETLRKVDMIAAQTVQDAERFVSLGANKKTVSVTGNLKFDLTIPANTLDQAQSLKHYFSTERLIWIAASTHEGEEKIILEAHQQILQKHPNTILILCPRHPERIKAITILCQQFGFDYKKRTDQTPFPKNCSVYLLDTLGELQAHYGAAALAFVGGSLVKTGGQNMIEPTSLKLPILTGPYTHNFIEITELLKAEAVLHTVTNALELANEVCRLLADPALRNRLGQRAYEAIQRQKGNIDRLMTLISPYL